MTIGNITQDDLYQAVAIFFCLTSVAMWLYVLLNSSSPLYFLPPIIASGVTFIFYCIIILVPMTVQSATLFSSTVRLTDMMMWTISGAAMVYIIRRNGRRL